MNQLIAWELKRPNAVTWELQLFGPPDYSFDDINDTPLTTLLSARGKRHIIHAVMHILWETGWTNLSTPNRLDTRSPLPVEPPASPGSQSQIFVTQSAQNTRGDAPRRSSVSLCCRQRRRKRAGFIPENRLQLYSLDRVAIKKLTSLKRLPPGWRPGGAGHGGRARRQRSRRPLPCASAAHPWRRTRFSDGATVAPVWP